MNKIASSVKQWGFLERKWGNLSVLCHIVQLVFSLAKILEPRYERQSGWLTKTDGITGRFLPQKKNKKVSCRICSIWLPIRHHLLKIQWHQVKSFPWKQIFFLLNKEKRSNLIILLQDILKLIVGFSSPPPRGKTGGLVSPTLSELPSL